MPELLAPDVKNYLQKERAIKESGKPIPEKMNPLKVEQLPIQLIDISNEVAKISGTWNPVEIYGPDGISQEREKLTFLRLFEEGQEYNPSFDYPYANSLNLEEARKNLKEQLHKLRIFSHKDHGLRKENARIAKLYRSALYFKIKDDLATCDLALGIRTKDEMLISRAMKTKYPGVDQAILESASRIYDDIISNKKIESSKKHEEGFPLSSEEQDYLKNTELSDKEFADILIWGLEEYGILFSDKNTSGYKVIIDEDSSNLDVRDKSRYGPAVIIKKGRKTKLKEALRLLGHEITGHARISTNGSILFGLGGGSLKIDNEMLYEGGGKRYDEIFEQEFFGTQDGEPLPYYAFAVASAEQGASFYNIFTQQLDLRLRAKLKIPLEKSLPQRSSINEKDLVSAKNLAWTTTYRVMRGHTDTTNKAKYAMAKDLSYLRGWLIDKQLRENGLGYLNELAVIASGGLQYLAELELDQNSLPIPYQNLPKRYWLEVLKPRMEREKLQKQI